MNRATLRDLAEQEDIRADVFWLEGDPMEAKRPEMYVLEIVPGGWSVYYSERRMRRGEETFDTEDEACSDLFERLVRDPTTRK